MTTPNLFFLSCLRLLGHQNWIRFGLRDRILRFFCNPDTAGAMNFEIEFFGFQYKGTLSNFIDWHVYFFGAYEKANLMFLRKLIDRKVAPTFLDVGANIGQHSLFMSRYCGQIHAFEPWDPVRIKLEEKIRINQIKNITVHPLGFGAKDAKLLYFAPIGANLGTGSFIASHSPDNNRASSTLQVVNGDSYLANLDLTEVNLIKIDVEGFEKYVLAGLKATLKKYKPIVFMEYSDATRQSFSDEAEIRSLLPEGYLIKRVSCDRKWFFFFNKSNCQLEESFFDMPGGDILLFPAEVAESLNF